MKSGQDRIPTHALGDVMAVDSHGRVLRKPHFLTMAEHEAHAQAQSNAWTDVLMAERRKVQEAEAKYAQLLFAKTVSIEIVDNPKILARKRLHWMVRWLVRVAD